MICQSAQYGFRTTEELHAESLAPIHLLADQRDDLSVSAPSQWGLICGDLHQMQTSVMTHCTGVAASVLQNAGSSLVALRAALEGAMEEQQGVTFDPSCHTLDDCTRTRETSGRVADDTLGLESSHPQPVVYEGEACAAVVVLAVFHTGRRTVLEHHQSLRDAIRDSAHELRKVDRRVRVVVHAKEQYLAIEFVHVADGTGWSVRGHREWVSEDLVSPWSLAAKA
jgi:hypothetical protein